MRKTQEEEVVAVLKKEGFEEIPESEIENEPYKTIYTLPECITENKSLRATKTKAAK
ncbi:MAG: hypothetical protein ABSH06_17390 [Thermodesulfobacteriota bacterium]